MIESYIALIINQANDENSFINRLSKAALISNLLILFLFTQYILFVNFSFFCTYGIDVNSMRDKVNEFKIQQLAL